MNGLKKNRFNITFESMRYRRYAELAQVLSALYFSGSEEKTVGWMT